MRSWSGAEPAGEVCVPTESRRGLVDAILRGADVSELVHAAANAIVAEVPPERLRHVVPSFPTRSEVRRRLLETPGL
jgi:dihydrolipoamide dehydrogenase